MTKPDGAGFEYDPVPATVKISYTVFGKTFVYEASFDYVPSIPLGHGVDGRVMDFFRNSYQEAREEYRHTEMARLARCALFEKEQRERALFEELKKKYAG